MILVPNLPQQSNGSKINIVLLAFMLLCVFSACDVPKQAKTSTPTKDQPKDSDYVVVYNPKTQKYEKVLKNAPKDTGNTTAPPKEKPKDTKPKETEVEDYSKLLYNIAYLLPFYTDKTLETDAKLYDKSSWAVNFYAGVNIALDSLSNNGLNLKVNTFDTKASETTMATILQKGALQKADIIVGAETKANVKMAADFAKQNDKILFSPYNPNPDIVNNNPNFVQVAPSLKTICEAIFKHAYKKVHNADQIILIAKNKTTETDLFSYFQNANIFAAGGTNAAKSLKEIVIADETATFVKTDFKPYIKAGQTTIFIVPSWTGGENFAASLLRKIDVDRGKNQVIVYGMPQWLNYDLPTLEFFESLNVHLPISNFVDKDSEQAINFMNKYFNRYQIAPNTEAYLGYDLTLYLGKMLSKYGKNIQNKLELEPYSGLQGSFLFERAVPAGSGANENYDKIDRLENKAVNIVKFKNHYFQKD